MKTLKVKGLITALTLGGALGLAGCNPKTPTHTHTWDEGTVTAPTCTADGYTTKHCTGCDETQVVDQVTKLGHSWDDGEETTPATCKNEGEMTLHCTREGCSETDVQPISKLTTHSYGQWTTVEEPSLMAEGSKVRTCGECGADDDGTIERTSAPFVAKYHDDFENGLGAGRWEYKRADYDWGNDRVGTFMDDLEFVNNNEYINEGVSMKAGWIKADGMMAAPIYKVTNQVTNLHVEIRFTEKKNSLSVRYTILDAQGNQKMEHAGWIGENKNDDFISKDVHVNKGESLVFLFNGEGADRCADLTIEIKEMLGMSNGDFALTQEGNWAYGYATDMTYVGDQKGKFTFNEFEAKADSSEWNSDGNIVKSDWFKCEKDLAIGFKLGEIKIDTVKMHFEYHHENEYKLDARFIVIDKNEDSKGVVKEYYNENYIDFDLDIAVAAGDTIYAVFGIAAGQVKDAIPQGWYVMNFAA